MGEGEKVKMRLRTFLVIFCLLALMPVSSYGASGKRGGFKVSVSFLTPGYENGVYFVEQGGSYISRITSKLSSDTVFGIVVKFNNGPEIVTANWQLGSQKTVQVASDCPLGDYILTEIFVDSRGYRETVWLGTMILRVVKMGDIPNSARGNGNSLIVPEFAPGQAPTNVVGLRYRVRVDQNQTPGMQIIFTGSMLSAPGSAKLYHLEYNTFSNRIIYQDGTCTGYPPIGQIVDGEASVRLGFADYNLDGKFGGITSNAKALPRQLILIDGIKDLQSLSMIPQTNLNGKDLQVEVSRGQLVVDRRGWGVCSNSSLPTDESYRMWHTKITFDGQSFVATFALPANGAMYFRDIMGIWTEFLSNPGYWRTYYWDIQFQREGNYFWEPSNNWRVIYNFGGSSNPNGFGFRLGQYKNQPVIEVSNDETETYLKSGEALTLAPSMVSVSLPSGGKR